MRIFGEKTKTEKGNSESWKTGGDETETGRERWGEKQRQTDMERRRGKGEILEKRKENREEKTENRRRKQRGENKTEIKRRGAWKCRRGGT